MNQFQKAKDMFRLQREAKKIKKELKNIHVEAEAQGVMVTVSAEQEIVGISIAESVPREKIAQLIIDAANRAMKKAQVVSAERMQSVMSELGIGA